MSPINDLLYTLSQQNLNHLSTTFKGTSRIVEVFSVADGVRFTITIEQTPGEL